MKCTLNTFALGLSLVRMLPAWAGTTARGQHQWAFGACSDTHRRRGEKGDKAQGKPTLKHSPPAESGHARDTMVFRVRDAGWLDRARARDNFRFLADMANGLPAVAALEAVEP